MIIEFVSSDATKIEAEVITGYELIAGYTLAPGDPRRLFLIALAALIVQLKSQINTTGKQNLLKYATGEKLDALGERVNCPRLAAKAASVTMRFTLSDAQAAAITIPSGTRVSPDGRLFFATSKDLIISAGRLYGDVAAQATETGETHNGYVAGQINRLVDVDNAPFVTNVVNINTSSGGDEEEADDDGINIWSGYRERIRESPASFSTAGPEDAYIYWAKTADTDIADVKATLIDIIKEFNLAAFQAAYPSVDPTPFYTEIPGAKVQLTVLMANGELPTGTILTAVEKACAADKRRPLTDYLAAAAPTTVPYDITLTYYISKDDSANEAIIRSAVEGTDGAVDQYKAWQCARMNRAIDPGKLEQLCRNAGASRLVITSPTYTVVGETAVALMGAVNITYGGLE